MTSHRTPQDPITIDRVDDLGSVLGVWAHPDDETYLSGGIMSALRSEGIRVACITATRGELGGDGDGIDAIRTRELDDALRILGVEEHTWLDYRDGSCNGSDPTAGIDAITRALTSMRPDTVLTFAPDGLTGHDDHRAVSRWTSEALRRSGLSHVKLLHAAVSELQLTILERLDRSFGVLIDGHRPRVTPTDQLDVDVRLPITLLERKVKALRALGSQTAPIIDELGLQQFWAWVATEHFVVANGDVHPRASDLRASGERGIRHSDRHIHSNEQRQEQS
jgi:LmbE family N-acetylglucosaminyl deacetylase